MPCASGSAQSSPRCNHLRALTNIHFFSYFFKTHPLQTQAQAQRDAMYGVSRGVDFQHVDAVFKKRTRNFYIIYTYEHALFLHIQIRTRACILFNTYPNTRAHFLIYIHIQIAHAFFIRTWSLLGSLSNAHSTVIQTPSEWNLIKQTHSWVNLHSGGSSCAKTPSLVLTPKQLTF